MIDQPLAQVTRPVRYPLEPITITDPYALMAIKVGAMMNDMLPKNYLLVLIDQAAQEFHDDLGEEMIRPKCVMSPEEYAAYLARQQ